MYKKQNKYILVIIILITIFVIFGFIKAFFNTNSKSTYDITNISIYRIEESISKNITSRQILKKDNMVFVGYSKKEIENGYYDLKIALDEKSIIVYINKLWKEFNESLYEKDYVNETVNSIFDVFEINDKLQKESLANYIIQEYLISKGINKEEINKETLNINKIEVNSEIEKSQLVLTVCKEVDDEK